MYENNYKIVGLLHKKFEVKAVSETFKKREFILAAERVVHDGMKTELIRFQCVQDKIILLDLPSEGSKIMVSFMVTGRLWTDKKGNDVYFNNNDCYDIEVLEMVESSDLGSTVYQKDDITDSLPMNGIEEKPSLTKEEDQELEDELFGKKKQELGTEDKCPF